MQDPYGERYEIHVNPGYGRSRFSRREVMDIAVSMIVLTVAFVILRRGIASSEFFVERYGSAGAWAMLFGICLVLVVVSFLLHEFGHKFMAQRYGMWSEYRMYPTGLLFTLVTSLFGFLFAAPGAVYTRGCLDSDQNGKVNMAGPLVNIVLALISVVALAALLGVCTEANGMVIMTGTEYIVFLVMSMMLSLNGFLAVFNLLPIRPLDGSKILPWNKAVWAAMIVIAVAVLVYYFYFLPDTVYIWG